MPEPYPIKLQYRVLEHGQGLQAPSYQSSQAAGMDLRAACPENVPIELAPGLRCLIPTGLAIALPPGHEGQIRPRSGLALNHGVTCLNSPGTIDADYRGEIKVLLINHGAELFHIERGMRIAQLVIAPVVQTDLHPVVDLAETQRGESGFGSSGVA